MTEAGCAFRTVIAALEHSEPCSGGHPGTCLARWETSHTPRVASPEEYADTLAAIRRHLA